MSLLLGIGLLLASAAADPNVHVSVTLDPPEIPYHKKAQYTIAVEAPKDLKVTLPEMLEQFPGLTVSDVKRTTKDLWHGRRLTTETYVLDAIWASDYKIYPAQVSWADGSVTVPSPALRVRDLTDQEKEAASQFAEIADPITPKKPVLRDWRVWLGIGALAAAVLGCGGYVLWARRRKAKEVPPAPPWEVAYQRLRELDQRQLPGQGKFEPYYVDLSAILRYYIEDLFLLHAPEQTTQEFLSAAARSGKMTVDHQQLLAAFLRHCDRVKFAQYVPEVREMEQSFSTVLQFVDETVPTPAPEAGAAVGGAAGAGADEPEEETV